jgi:hypothetical protein
MSKPTHLLVFVVAVITLSVTSFKDPQLSAKPQEARQRAIYKNQSERYPVVEADEAEPGDPVKKEKLSQQKLFYDKDAPFTSPGPNDEELAFLPEWQFNFPGLPVSESDVIVIGEVLSAKAHRSNNKRNVFTNFEIKIDEVLKGNELKASGLITVQRIGGFVKYPDGRKVLFRLVGNGMPAVGSRCAFFLKQLNQDYGILTGYELAAKGVTPLDHSRQFELYQGLSETDFLKTLRAAASPSVSHQD